MQYNTSNLLITAAQLCMQSVHQNSLYYVYTGFDLCAAIWCHWPAGCCICMSTPLWIWDEALFACSFLFFLACESLLNCVSSQIHLFLSKLLTPHVNISHYTVGIMWVQGPDLDSDAARELNENRTEGGILQCGRRKCSLESQNRKMLPVPDIGQWNRITCRMTHTKIPQTETQSGAASTPHPL